MVAFFAGQQAQVDRQEFETERRTRPADDPHRKAAYDAVRTACFFDTETRFPGRVPHPLTPKQRADLDLVASLRANAPPSWAAGDPVRAALYDVLVVHTRSRARHDSLVAARAA